MPNDSPKMPGRRQLSATVIKRGYMMVLFAMSVLIAVNISTLMHDAVGGFGLPAWKSAVCG